jgi:YaiO family outer membrane protein
MKVIFFSLALFLLSNIFNLSYAGNGNYSKRLEFGGSYEYLLPNDTYGSWKIGRIKFFDKPTPTFDYFLGIDGFSRIEGSAILFEGGAYKHWNDWFYTYTALSGGSNSVYLPKYRADQNFYFAVGPKKNIVLIAGATYIKYFDVHRYEIFSLGSTYYSNGWNLTYQHFFNISNPGSVYSSLDLVSLGIGSEGNSWTYFNVSYGKEAYLATYIATPQVVTHNSLYLEIKRQQWLGKTWGITTGISFLKLQEGYDKYGISFGIFKDF